MKKFFSNPVVAMILAVVVVIGSVVVNTRVKLGRECEAVSGRFYGASSIADDLLTLCGASEKLVLLGTRCGVTDAEDAMEPIGQIRELVRERSYEAGAIFEQYDQLLKDTFALESQLARMDLGAEDAEAYSGAQHSAAEAKAGIDGSAYNDSVRSFLKHNGSFPTPQIAAFSGVSLPEYFA